MNCMKCGRETAGPEVFCEKCLAAIARYPVKPGTAVHLPKRNIDAPRVRKKRPPTREEVIASLRNKLRRRKLAILILVLLLLLCLIAIAFLQMFPPQQSILPWFQPQADLPIVP